MNGRQLTSNKSVREVFLAWLLSRLALWAIVFWGDQHSALTDTSIKISNGWRGVPSPWLSLWTTFDSRYLIEIARSGYTPLRSAFFPLYPFLLRAFGGPSASENTLALVGIVVSNFAFAGALWLLFCLTRDEWGEAVARRAVWLEAFFPLAAFGAAVYTESLFLMLSLGLFWFARQKKWWASGLFGFLAGLTRNSGPILFVALLLDRPKDPLSRDEKRRRFACALCPLFAFLAVQVAFHLSGNSEGIVQSQRHFGRGISLPILPILFDLRRLVQNPLSLLDISAWPQLVACLGAFALIWAYRRQFSPGKLLFLGAVVLLDLTITWKNEPHVRSTLRFLFATFPFVQLLALWSLSALSSPRATLYAGVIFFLLFALHSYYFGQKWFLG